MLRIEVDIMSGRPNPEWIITDQNATQELLRAVAEAPAVAAKIGAGYAGLGFRGAPRHAHRRRPEASSRRPPRIGSRLDRLRGSSSLGSDRPQVDPEHDALRQDPPGRPRVHAPER